MASRELTNLSISLAGGKPDAETSSNGVNTNFRSMDGGAGGSDLNSTINKSLNDAAKKLSGGVDEKTIMERFAARAGLTKQAGAADRKLTEATYGEDIASQLDSNANQYIQAAEGRSGFGTKTAAVTYLEKSGAKRVMDLEKQRDSLLLQSKVLEAERLDGLIVKEQEAITEARKNWLSDLLNLGQESRNLAQEDRDARSFETPQEARTRDLVASEAEARFGAIRGLTETAPDAGILSTDDYNTAITKFRNSASYKRNERLGELEIQQIEADIRNTNSLASNRGLGGGSSSSIISSVNTQNPGSSTVQMGDASASLDSLAGRVPNLIMSENGKETFYKSYNAETTPEGKLNTIAGAVVANGPAEVKLDFINTGAALSNIDAAIQKLESGVNTGVVPFMAQNVMNAATGKDYDKNMTELEQLIVAALQPYRSSVTGAAWGSQETAEYNKLFGSAKYEPEELLTRLNGLKAIMQRGRMNVVTSALIPFGDNRNLTQTIAGVAYPDYATSESTTEFGLSDDDFKN